MDASFRQSFRWFSLVITLPILFYASRPFFTAAFRDLKNFRVGMDVPVSLGIGIAFIASTANTISGDGEVYFDSVSMFTFFLLTARYFEMTARKRTSESTEALLNLQPAIATKLVDENGLDKQLCVPVAELIVGDRVLVRPGENIPADGSIIDGTSGINESLITGESLPVTKTKDDAVIGGSTNTESPLIIKIDKVGDDTVLASIHRLLDGAQHNKPAIAKLADQLASKFVAIILLIATGVALYWYQTDPQQWIAITIATLVVTCPCALSLATPTAITAASGQLAKLGLLPTNSLALETLAKTTDFVFDKTGTLTQGNIKLIKTISLNGEDKEQYIKIAAALESCSEHPIAKSIIQAANEIDPGESKFKASEITNTPGSGIKGIVNNTQWYLGNLNYIQSVCKTPLPESELDRDNLKDLTVVALATEEKIHALFSLDDELRDEAKSLINALQKENKTITLMTGDHKPAALRIAAALGIKNVFSNLKPADKLERVRDMQHRGAIVAMTGDGINDAPVLAGANISIAMGSGTQLAAAHADMILLSNHIEHLYSGYRVATKTIAIIRQNLTWAFGYNLLAVPAAAMGYVEPWLAAIGMSASSLLVVLNALRLTRLKN
jgi:Cu2+-exporting ATPase